MLIPVLIFVVLIIMAVTRTLWLAFLALFLAGALGVCWLWKVFLSDGLFWVVAGEGKLDLGKERCTACDGCGVQWFDPAIAGWTIFPLELRGFHKKRPSWEFLVNQANYRKCPCCLGVTFHWVRKRGKHRCRMPN